jgi:hypothetical protein
MITTILQYSTIDLRFLEVNLRQLSKFSDEIIIPICSHLFNGETEDSERMIATVDVISRFSKASYFIFEWEGAFLGTRYYHNLSRKLGTEKAKNEWLLFVDADEILSDEFGDWFETVKNTDNAYWFTCHWYFREAIYRATRTEGAGMLIRKKYCNWDVYSHQERQQLIGRTPNFHNGEGGPAVLSLTNQPMMHHFSWVRNQDEMLAKVRNWGHNSDKDWISCVNEEFSRPFNGRDFVHGYSFVQVENTFNI